MRIPEADLQLSSPATDALALSALNPEVGHSFLDVGSGSGYLTMLASHMVAYSGTAVGVDVSLSTCFVPTLVPRDILEHTSGYK